MKTEIKQVNVLEPKWWNPLFWLYVFLAPLCGIISGAVVGAFFGLLIGYDKGLETAGDKLNEMIKLP